MKLKSSPKIFDNYKCDYPQNTIKRVNEGFKKIGLDIKYKGKAASSGNCSVCSGKAWIYQIGFGSYGKSSTSILAKASAYAELAERFSAGFLGFFILDPKSSDYFDLLEDVFNRTYIEGFTENNDPSSFDLEKVSIYFIEKPSINTYQLLKKCIFSDHFVNAYSIVNKNTIKVPIHLVDMLSGSNGLASGNTFEEAITEAACEVFERYVASKIVSEKIKCNTIDPLSINDERVHRYIDMFKSMNIDVIIKDFTLNNSLPVIGTLFINHNLENDENHLKKDLYYKTMHAGSDINLVNAILRCFIEHLQGLNSEELMYAKKLDKIYDLWVNYLGKSYIKPEENYKWFFREYDLREDLLFLEKGKIISFDKLTHIENDDSFDDVKDVIKFCKTNHWDIQVIDLTHKIIQFPTVRTIIPPISSDHDLHLRQMLKLNTDEQHFNFFYGIDNIFYYVFNKNWIKEKEKIQQLIKNLEEFLTREPNSFNLELAENMFFFKYVNLYYILALCNLSIGNYEEALKYFQVLYRLDYKPATPSCYHDTLFSLKYNRQQYKLYIKIIEKELIENKKSIDFKLEKNPFSAMDMLDKPEKKSLKSLFKNINKSYI